VTRVLFVPRMRVNVLSAAALEDQGYGVEFYGLESIFSLHGEKLQGCLLWSDLSMVLEDPSSSSQPVVLPAVPASITTGLGLYQKGLLLHEVIGPRYHGMCHI
jgi:hypothetical protein